MTSIFALNNTTGLWYDNWIVNPGTIGHNAGQKAFGDGKLWDPKSDCMFSANHTRFGLRSLERNADPEVASMKGQAMTHVCFSISSSQITSYKLEAEKMLELDIMLMFSLTGTSRHRNPRRRILELRKSRMEKHSRRGRDN